MGKARDVFIAYYEQYKNKIFVYFLYRVNFNRDIAEDLTSEVFLKAFDKFDSFEAGKSFQAWVFAIAHNHLVNYYRVANREVELLENQPSRSSELERIELNYEIEKIFKAINEMDDSDRDILLLRFVDQLSNTEIAELLGKEEGAIRTKMSRSLSKLRSILDE